MIYIVSIRCADINHTTTLVTSDKEHAQKRFDHEQEQGKDVALIESNDIQFYDMWVVTHPDRS